MSKLGFGIVSIWISFWSFGLAGPNLQEEDVSVKGYVFDSEGKPVKDAEILIISSSIPGRPMPAKTNEKGYYEKSFKAGGSFDISYNHTDAGAAVVVKLSGTKNQEISILLYKNNQLQNMPPNSIFAELQAYEYASFVAKTSEPNDVSKAFARMLNNRNTMSRLSALHRRIDAQPPGIRKLLTPKIYEIEKIIFKN